VGEAGEGDVVEGKHGEGEDSEHPSEIGGCRRRRMELMSSRDFMFS
jgi:hypothetical protein